VSKKSKLISRLRGRPKDFTWDEACTLMRQCGFKLESGSGGSGRMFTHQTTRQRVRLHEPHPQNTLLSYMLKELIEALKDAGEITE
jgi:hypothetical protein